MSVDKEFSEFSIEIRKDAEEQIAEHQRKIDYDIRDFTIDYITDQFNKKRFFIPDYQREFVWNNYTQSRFIESLLLGIPIPFLFLSIDKDTGNLEVVDGAQRIQTLDAFVNNKLELKGLTKLTKINNFRFKDLTSSVRRKFENRPLRMIVLEDLTTLESRKEIFNRINTAGVKASPIEVRMGTYDGPFIEFIKRLALNEKFKKLIPLSNNAITRKENYEVIFRFFAYSDNLEEYSDNITVLEFIDNYTSKNQINFDKERMEYEFNRMLDFTEKNFPIGFRRTPKAKSTPKARFEALAVGINLALRENPNLEIENIDWIHSQEFINVTTSDAANNKSKLIRRIEFVKNSLLRENQ